MHDSLLNKYISLIDEDKNKSGSYNRYPVRFIILPFSMLGANIITDRLKRGGTEVLELSSLLNKPEGWIDTLMVLNKIKTLNKEKDIIVTGFSELVRFYKKSEFESLLISLVTDIENSCENASRRIYFFCFGLYDHIYKVLCEKHERIKVFNPLLYPEPQEESEYVKLYFTDNSSIYGLVNIQVTSVESWLSIWKRANLIDYPLVCGSQTLNYWYNYAKPDNVFAVEKLDNEKDILHKIFGIELNILFHNSERHFWKQLLNDVYKFRSKSLSQLVENVFNINNVFNADFIKLWFDSKNEYYKWLLLLLFKELRQNMTFSEYLSFVINNVESYDNDELARVIWMGIFEYKRFDLTDQRKELIVKVRNYYSNFEIFESDFVAAFESINDIKVKKELLTPTTIFEKKMIINFYKENIYSISEIAKVYPEFAAYICENNEVIVCDGCEWIKDYFYQYKHAKVQDYYTEELMKLVEQMNGNGNRFYKWYYNHKLEFISDIIKREQVNRIILLDGVGAEYLTLLLYFITKKGWNANKALYAKCLLPSITKYNNKVFEVDKFLVPDFDRDVTHDKYYKSPESIIKAIDTIEKIFNSCIHIKHDERVAIIADHGCTAIHRLVKGSKVYDYQGAEHDGRCLLDNDERISENEHYIAYKNAEYDERWIIALRDVSLCKRSAYEVHGGATPEEIIVPFIIVTKDENTNNITINYKVTPVNIKVSGLSRKISFEITPKPEEQPMLNDEFGNEYKLTSNDGVWEAELKQAGKQKVSVIIGTKIFIFDVKSTLEEDDLF